MYLVQIGDEFGKQETRPKVSLKLTSYTLKQDVGVNCFLKDV